MFTATNDLILPTALTGASWPRPTWFREQLGGKPLSERMTDLAFREQYLDALTAVVNEQERAGLDIVHHGDFHHDQTLGGWHWIGYNQERLDGIEMGHRIEGEVPHHGPGRILYEVFSGWRIGQIVDHIQRSEDRPLEFAKIWRLTQARATKPVMFGTISSQELAWMANISEDSPYDRDSRRQVIWDTATAMNQELRELAAAGCEVISIELPSVHLIAFDDPKSEEIDFLVDAFNQEVAGLENVEVWVHTCWGSAAMQHGIDEWSYRPAIEHFLERMNFDVWTVEAKSDGGDVIEMLAPYADTLRQKQKKIAIGAVSHRRMQVERPDEVAAFVRRALKSIPLEHLALTSDCGFGRGGSDRLIPVYKAAALAQGANIVRRELGFEEREVRMADPRLQIDL